MNRTHDRIRWRWPAATATVVAAVAAGLGVAQPALAAGARVVVGPATADPDYATTLSVSGTGFQSVKGGFGGIYVLFGTVDGKWRPSQGGASGTDYVYVPDAQTKKNNGFQKFVSFIDGSTLAEANGGVIGADGSWHTTLVVPGAKFSATGTGGKTRQVDCTREQCGVITIGAHGVVSPRNETFTPVTFAVPRQQKPAASATKPPVKTTTKAATTAPAAPVTTPPTTTPPPAPSSAAAPPAPSGGPASGTPAPSTTPVATTLHTSSGDGLRVAGIAAAAVVVAGGGAVLVRRRRKRRTPAGS
ncbi:hypothetical protein OG552_31885 [Streptomyces sp. NBC_01476]|uniref:hypothetical protein n=1 Tax=Streptomyces sp. NBC_01476 TaxID=2903881 RepID=UPI002E373795|nr:hypothetical protein [Streptomyces sp. NBC_01476]